ncbi:uncharacterized protein dbf4b isoform X2 [Salmo trutta]|uniref:uncharacterized protein dbf4b isoform X2 n=1 Tax=Salmo trutta TaxID=8032 RepID=UPI00113169B0|nr:uncharacterized protein LOC115160607 isoform X2 [Salmo trutta]
MQQPPPGAGGCFLGMLSPGHGGRKLEGKSFYLDAVKSRPAAFLAEAISHLGGRIESFLNKDVSFVVTGSLEGLRSERFEITRGGSDGMTGECHSSPRSTKPRESIMTSTRQQRPATGTPRPMVCGSRGKALLEKAIRNNERLQGNSVLANARSWGVKIVHVDDLLTHVQLLTAESSKARRRKTELKNPNKCPAVSRVIKAGALKSPYLKVEDSSRKYKALHMQSMAFPTLCYSGRFSPFEPPAPPQPERVKEEEQKKARQIIKSLSTSQDNPRSPLPRNPSLCRARKKNLGYCECCHEPFKDQDEHMQSAQHRGFVQDPSHYSLVDQLVADMEPGFAPCPAPESASTTLLRLETLPLLLQLPHSPSEMQTHSETEHAIQALLTQGSPSNTLDPDPSPPTPSLVPLSSHAQPLSPCPDTPSLLLLPSLPQPLSSCPDNHPPSPDTLCQSPTLAPLPNHSQPLSPNTQCQPPSPYSQPPVLSPKTMFPFEPMSQPDSPYSQPPVLSPQVLLQPPTPHHPTEGEDVEIADADRWLSEVEPVPQTVPGRSRSLPRLWITAANPNKRSRSVSPDTKACKRRRTSLINRHKSKPIWGFNSAGWTRKEHQPLVPSTYTDNGHELVAKAYSLPKELGTAEQRPTPDQLEVKGISLVPTMTQESINKVGNGVGIRAANHCHSVPIFGPGHAICPSMKVDKITSWPPVEVFGTNCPSFATSARSYTRSFPRLPVKSTGNLSGHMDHSIFVDGGVVQQHATVTPNISASFPPQLLHHPSDRPTHCPASSQDSNPCHSQSVTSVCIESALLPDLAIRSDSDSDWECDLMSRLGPPAATSAPSTSSTLSLPQPAGSHHQQLDLELLQRPCSTWTLHDTSYESHLCAVLQQPLTLPPDPSLVFSKTVMESIEVTRE